MHKNVTWYLRSIHLQWKSIFDTCVHLRVLTKSKCWHVNLDLKFSESQTDKIFCHNPGWWHVLSCKMTWLKTDIYSWSMWETTFTRGWDHRICHVIYVEDYLTNNPCVRRHMRSGQKRQDTTHWPPPRLPPPLSSRTSIIGFLCLKNYLLYHFWRHIRQMHFSLCLFIWFEYSKVEVLLGCWGVPDL